MNHWVFVIVAATAFGTGLRAAEPVKPPVPAAPTTGQGAASSKRLLPEDANKAWAIVEAEGKPPGPPAEWKGRQPTSDEVKAFRKQKATGSGIAADKAREFFQRFKDHAKADRKSTRLNSSHSSVSRMPSSA